MSLTAKAAAAAGSTPGAVKPLTIEDATAMMQAYGESFGSFEAMKAVALDRGVDGAWLSLLYLVDSDYGELQDWTTGDYGDPWGTEDSHETTYPRNPFPEDSE